MSNFRSSRVDIGSSNGGQRREAPLLIGGPAADSYKRQCFTRRVASLLLSAGKRVSTGTNKTKEK